MKTKKLWFKAKLYGWGWQPITWQGWAVTLLYIVAIVLNAKTANMYSHSVSDGLMNFSIPFIINTIFLLVVCYAHGERPRWRWGK